MTGTLPPPPPPPVSAPSARPAAGKGNGPATTAAGAPSPARGGAGAGGVRRGVRDTPGRMRLVSTALVLVGVLVGLAAGQAFWSADTALRRAAENAAQIVRVQDIQTSLVRADAGATNAFLVGGLEPVEQREEYEQAVARASALVAEAAAAQPADGAALAVLNTSILGYTADVTSARVNNRQGLPVGAQYLRNAGAGLRSEALPLLDALGEANAARAEAEFDAAGRARVLAFVACALGVVAAVAALVWLARRTHRYVNLPVAGAALLIILVFVACAIVLGSVAGTVAGVRAGEYATARALSDARIAAFDAKANESLTLISRGSGAAYESAWAESSDVTTARLADATGLRGDLADLEGRWATYTAAHGEIRGLDDGGQWEQAVAAATSRDAGSANDAFGTFDAASAERLAEAGEATTSTLRAAGSGLALAGWLSLLAGLLIAGLAWWGLAQRIEEYR